MLKKIVVSIFCIMYTLSGMAFGSDSPGVADNSLCPLPRKAGNYMFRGQYFEDFILSIVFSNIDKGTYVDVGAHSPISESVTIYFYRKGWSGVNIEPLPNRYAQLAKARPRDINVNVGISDKTIINKKFYRVHSKEKPLDDGLSTFDENIKNQAVKDGFLFETILANVTTLEKVLDANRISNINFLKIDVEGNEKQVLKSVDFKKYRPQVLLIESTEPRTFVDASYKWQDILTKNNYVLILFDGLNSYYVAKEDYKNLYGNFLKAYDCIISANKKFHVIDNEIKFTFDKSQDHISS